MLRIFFRRLQLHGREKIPTNTPKIIVTNHQNAFLDAIITGAFFKEHNMYFLTRASVFKNPIARWILSQYKMLPIYRIRDGVSAVKKNDEIFERCVKILEKKGTLLIFAEGNHGTKKYLRPLQKGISRIAFEAEQRHNFNLNVQIVPIGLNYEDISAFRNNFFMNVGDPFAVKDFQKEFEQDANAGMLDLKDKLAEHLRPLIINISPDNYEEVEGKWLALRERQPTLKEQFEHDQNLINEIEKGDVKVKSPKKREGNFWGNPLCWYAAINHFIPFLIIKSILRPVKDRAFWASIKYALGMFLVPMFYFIQFSLIYYISNDLYLSVAYLVSLPIIGIGVYDYYKSEAI